MTTFRRLYEEPGQYLSLERAIDLDKQANNMNQMGEKPSQLFSEIVYRQPNLRQETKKPLPFSRSFHVDDIDDAENPDTKGV